MKRHKRELSDIFLDGLYAMEEFNADYYKKPKKKALEEAKKYGLSNDELARWFKI